MTELPAGHTVRPTQVEDAEAIHRLAARYFERILGRPMVTLSEIIEGLTAPTITLERDSWLVLGNDGQVAGNGFVLLGGDHRFASSSPLRTSRCVRPISSTASLSVVPEPSKTKASPAKTRGRGFFGPAQ
jgi:hypothetical protein